MKSLILFSIFVIYSTILLLAGSSIDYNFFKSDTKINNQYSQLRSDQDCIISDRLCVFYRYKFDEKLRINISIQPGRVYVPLSLLSIYDPMVNIYKTIPRTEEQLDKFNELMSMIKIVYEENRVFNKITDNKTNEINIIFKDKHGFILHRTVASFDMNKSEVIGPTGKLIAFQFEINEDISKNIYSKIEHKLNEISWTTALHKELEFIEETYY